MSLHYLGIHEFQKMGLFSYAVYQNDTPLACYIFDNHEPILLIFGSK